MQRTRLNTLFDESLGKFGRFFQNPWRRFALTIISLLFGNFIGTVVPTTSGQKAAWDPVVGAGILIFIELVSRIYYSRPKLFQTSTDQDISKGNHLCFDLLNIFKIGLIYGLIVEALELGS
ncbi:hypothetical protein Lepto7376_0138 [[Leptolyngbya] sp. PCC 7376]|uniref:DUF565 domain-containing protein n=1 Tax=[Leptolyngbya] sp. PCC 7376 TaxID=111781 RepID=UPI00029EE54B|nr:DUF565 domain-containing protein [[Leptolyngbya] sp. PCC 7376]AFY36586.1 hypothetical protein Lepto7376_0138 [[Leptolyngbya] sp. PCC 7376]